MIPYILIAVSLGLTGLVAFTRTRLAPVIVAASLVGNIASVELAKGWPTTLQPPRQGIVYAAVLGHLVLVGPPTTGTTPRYYMATYPPELEGMIKQNGAMAYDMDAVPSDGQRKGADGNGRFDTLGTEDFTSLERGSGDQK